MESEEKTRTLHFPLSILYSKLFVFFMQLMTATATAKLFQLQSSGRIFFVFRRYVVTFLALGALQNYVISRHYFLPLSFIFVKAEFYKTQP
jgi:hypothetical protein